MKRVAVLSKTKLFTIRKNIKIGESKEVASSKARVIEKGLGHLNQGD
jgi:hypothetical protein